MTLTLSFNDSILVPVVFENLFTGARYPRSGELFATLDTGYTGFAVVPKKVYRELGLSLFEPLRSKARTADGRTLELKGVHALTRIPELGLSLEGLVETASGIEETLLGIQWLKQLRLHVDGCTAVAFLEGCR